MRVRQEEQTLKKSILWNAVQPGDPYDIRKSMIARLPGQSQHMGNKLQLLCLLQAAEIQRLTINLQDYRVKLRQKQTRQLDRHSYQMQIKQLAGKMQGQEQLKKQIQKLKKFIDRLNREHEDKKNQFSTGNSQLSQKYDQALNQVYVLTQQIKSLSVQREQTETQLEDYQNKFAVLGKQIERLNIVLKSKKEDSQGAQIRLKQLQKMRQENDRLLRERTTLLKRISELQHQNKSIQDSVVQNYKKELNSYSEEITRSKKDLRKSQQETSIHKTQLQRYRQQSQTLRKQMDTLILQRNQLIALSTAKDATINSIQVQKHRIEQNSGMIGRQVQRLNAVLRGKVDEVNILQVKLKKIIQQNQHYVSQVNILEQQAVSLKQIHQKMQQLQFDLTNQRNAKERFSKIYQQLQNQTKQERQKISSYQQTVMKISDQMSRLHKLVEKKNKDIEEYQRQLTINKNAVHQQELTRQSLINKLNQVSRQNQAKISQLLSQKSLLQQRYREQHNLRLKSQQYQTKLAMVSLQIDRLNSVLSNKCNQTKQLDGKCSLLTKQNQSLKKLHADSQFRLSQLIPLQNSYAKQNQEIQSLRQSQGRVVELQDDVQRLNNLLRLKVEEAARWQNSNRQLISRLDNLQYQLNGRVQENREISQQIAVLNQERNRFVSEKSGYQARFQQLLLQISALKLTLQKYQQQKTLLINQNSQLKTQLQQAVSKQKIQKLQLQLVRLYEIIDKQKQQIGQLRLAISQEVSYQKQSKDQLSLIMILFAQTQSLRKRLSEQQQQAIKHYRDSFL